MQWVERKEKMSLFVQQNQTICDFPNSDSWVILSPIEQSIKRKIEAVGTPLKDWDINIYRGVLTGYNEAFIIDSSKRDEILNNCQTEKERLRTAELIRPILRGRDIKRYCYEDSGLYLINTHNGIKGKMPRIEIGDYPAIKAHLDQYWDKIKDRADQGDTPYNLRNCAYMEDFNKPKLMWKIIGNRLAFAFDSKQVILNNACYLMTGEQLPYLLAFLNSREMLWYNFTTNMNKTGVGDAQLGAQNIQQFPIPKNKEISSMLTNVVNKFYCSEISNRELDCKIEEVIAGFLHLTDEEVLYLNHFATSIFGTE